MRFLAGMFGHRRTPTAEAPAPLKPEPLSAEAVMRLRREREEAERAEAWRREGEEEIRAACEAVGFWWPGMPRPEGRLSGRRSFAEKAAEAVREAWIAFRQ